MLDRETRKRIEDYFDPTELVDYLQVTTEEVVEAFEDKIDEHLEDIEEFIGVRRDNE